MVDSRLTLVLVQGHADPPVVVDALHAMNPGAHDHRILVVPRSGGDRDILHEGLLQVGDSAVCRLLPAALDVTELLASCTTSFVGVIDPEDPIDTDRLRSIEAVLDRHSDVSLVAPSIEPLVAPSSDGPTDGVVDGHEAALAFLTHLSARRHPASILFRRTALPSAISAPPWAAQSGPSYWPLWLAVEALARGSAIMGTHRASVTRQGSERLDSEGVEGWGRLLMHAMGLGLLDDAPLAVPLLVDHTRRVGQVLASSQPGNLVSDRGVAQLLEDVVALWRGIDEVAPLGTGSARPGVETVATSGVDRLLVREELLWPEAGASEVSGFRDWMPEPARSHRRRRSLPFVIAAPDYTERHGGVVALHRLCDRLNALGQPAFIVPLGSARGVTNRGWRTPLWAGSDLSDAILVYPEIVTGNPLLGHRIVRWLLHRPSWFTGSGMSEGPDDLIVTFDEQIAPDRPVVRVPLVDPTVFFPTDRARRGGLLWIGKGVVPADFDRSEVRLVTSSWPHPRPRLASLLRSATVLYSCDWLTSLIDEALMCATPVVLLGDQDWRRDEVAMRPGMTWEEDGLARATVDASTFYPRYLASLPDYDRSVEELVRMVDEHFFE